VPSALPSLAEGTRPARPRCGCSAGAVVTLLHRRTDLSETVPDYLIGELERYGGDVRSQRDLSPAGQERTARKRFSQGRSASGSLVLFLGAVPCTEWLGDVVARDDNGFILTGPAAGADNLLGTTIAGVFTAGDVRSGSTKRCGTAVGEGAWAVQLVHAHVAADEAVQ
jgi:thioredoxin reductase (NADPH)